MLPSVYEGGDYVLDIGGILDTRINYLERMNYFIYDSPFSHWFELLLANPQEGHLVYL